GAMAAKPLFIADGHHRYETGLRFLEERRAAGEVPNAEAAANFILMACVGMNDPGLLILPTHPLVSGFPGLTGEKLRTALAPHFDFDNVGTGEQGARQAWDVIQAEGSQSILGFGTTADDAWQTARFRSPALLTELAGEHSETWRSLAVSIL